MTLQDITERISQARKLFGSMNKQLLGNKKMPSQALSSDCCEYSTLGSESWALKKSRQVQTGSHHGVSTRCAG
jgi:hypothetical protein